MSADIFVGVITFRYTRDNIELLLINDGIDTRHPRVILGVNDDFEKSLAKSFTDDTGLNLLVISITPVFEYIISSDKENGEKRRLYYAGIVDNRDEINLKDENEYLWIDHLGGRNSITEDEEIEAYEYARGWLYHDDEAPLFMANNMQKLS